MFRLRTRGQRRALYHGARTDVLSGGTEVLAKKYNIEIKERELSDEEKLVQSERESLFIVQ